jgi:hypothetical protein
MRAAEELEFGEICINRTPGESIHVGYREAGIGGEDGKWACCGYTGQEIATESPPCRSTLWRRRSSRGDSRSSPGHKLERRPRY